MKGWSAPIVMNGNNICAALCFALLGAVMLMPAAGNAQESAAQGLYGVKEILVRPVRFDDAATAKSCRLDPGELDALIMKELQDNNLPAIPEAEARPSLMDVARINLIPQIVPYNSQGLDCVTWVSMYAESRNHLRVLPIEIPRVVVVLYWRQGQLVSSAVSVHADHVDNALHTMIHEFGVRYVTAQPPTVGRPNARPPR